MDRTQTSAEEEAVQDLEDRFFASADSLPWVDYAHLSASSGTVPLTMTCVPFNAQADGPEDLDGLDYMVSLELRFYRVDANPYLLLLALDYNPGNTWYGVLLDVHDIPVGELIPRGHGTEGRATIWSHHGMQPDPRFFVLSLSEMGAELVAEWLKRNVDAAYAAPMLKLKHSVTDRDVLDLLDYMENGGDPRMDMHMFYLDGCDLSEYISSLSPSRLEM